MNCGLCLGFLCYEKITFGLKSIILIPIVSIKYFRLQSIWPVCPSRIVFSKCLKVGLFYTSDLGWTNVILEMGGAGVILYYNLYKKIDLLLVYC